MIFRFTLSLSIFCLSLIMTGCTTLFSEQEWSENYALMEGVKASTPQMIDGNLDTVGETVAIGQREAYGSSWGSVVSIKLPEKKYIRRLVIHSDNIKKLNIYVDKGGSALSETDWHLIKEIKGVKSYPIVIPLLNTFPIDHFRILVTDTTDDHAIRRKEKAGVRQRTTPVESKKSGVDGDKRSRPKYPARISEIEIYGYKSAAETEAAKSDMQREGQFDSRFE